MKIQSVCIKNFRTLENVTIPFDFVTTFIGPNGAGKSKVYRALDWFFNGKLGSLAKVSGVAIFEDHLEAFMLANWNEWVAACDAVEAAAGINLAKSQLAYRVATLKTTGAVPEMLKQILTKAGGV